MAELIVTGFMTLDGVIEAPGDGVHPHAGWTHKDVEFLPEVYDLKGREQEEAGGILLGRTTWSQFHPVWPTMADFARYNSLPKFVVSTSLDPAEVAASTWQPMTLLRSLDEIARVKATLDGPLLVHGSATLAQSLAAAGLVDRYHLLVFPVVLGGGRRLFAEDGVKHRLSVISTRTFGNGIIELILGVPATA